MLHTFYSNIIWWENTPTELMAAMTPTPWPGQQDDCHAMSHKRLSSPICLPFVAFAFNASCLNAGDEGVCDGHVCSLPDLAWSGVFWFCWGTAAAADIIVSVCEWRCSAHLERCFSLLAYCCYCCWMQPRAAAYNPDLQPPGTTTSQSPDQRKK